VWEDEAETEMVENGVEGGNTCLFFTGDEGVLSGVSDAVCARLGGIRQVNDTLLERASV
jgi:hypothetical protein